MEKPWILNDISKESVQDFFKCVDENWTENHVRVNSSDIANCGLVFWLLYQQETKLNYISFYGNLSEKIRTRNARKIQSRFLFYFESQELAKKLKNFLLNLLKENKPRSTKEKDRKALNANLNQFRLDGLMWDSQSVAKLFSELFNVQMVLLKEDYLIVKTRLLELIENFDENWENKVVVDGKDLILDRKLALKRSNKDHSSFLYGELYRCVYSHSRKLNRPYQARVLDCLYRGLKERKYYEKSEIAKKINDTEKTVRNAVSEINKLSQECIERDILDYSNKGQSKYNNIVFFPDLECVKIETERIRRREEIKRAVTK